MPTLNMCSSLSSMVIMPFPLIYRMLIYIIPLLSIIILSYILFGVMCLISGRFYLLGLLQLLGVFCPSPNLFCSFAVTRVCVLLSIWMTSWSSFALSGWVRGHICFCVPCWSILVYISIFPKSDLCLSQTFCFLGLCWDTVQMSVSLPPDKLADIQQLALSLLLSQHDTVHRVMSFLGKANFCTNGHSQLQCLCHVIQSTCYMFIILPPSYFHIFIFSLSSFINWNS